MFSNSVQLDQIRQIEFKQHTDQVAHNKNVPTPAGEKDDSTTWRQYLILGLSKILVVAGQWLKSPNQLSF